MSIRRLTITARASGLMICPAFVTGPGAADAPDFTGELRPIGRDAQVLA
jgi:hypothetical protein